ncbi:MAG: hypothetical protein A3E82_01425 [Gammaproteobacteria bacterium RIFCSPHIGHO2_12_FULL_38_11]|nr:MAG: hypothetical protein A3E82_01425 [Gammaproteobacteria bacterium RIFCSPHIGHO2_12_FULL_38_11]
MNILITGGNGFVAREIINRLSSLGHQLTVCVRKLSDCVLSDPNIKTIQTDFHLNTEKSCWLPYLSKIDVVINCVGVFQTLTSKAMWDIHYHAPRALFDACQETGVKKIIHISALGIDKNNADYAKSKMVAETYLHTLTIDSIIIRPSFIYSHGSYGGSSLFRGLAALPFFIFLPADGEQLLQPIYLHDLVKIVEKSLGLSGKHLLCASGSEKISLQFLLNKMRAWLGFKRAINIKVPIFFIRIAAKFGDFFRNSPLSTTAVKLMMIDNVASDAEFAILTKTVGFTPRSFTQGLNHMISAVQDRWHARLFFLRPLLRLSIAFLWIFTGVISLGYANTFSYPLLTEAGIQPSLQPLLLYGASIVDLVLGFAVLCNYCLKITGLIQITLITLFTAIISIKLPAYWVHPFASIAKNIPLIVATLIMMALESDR